MLNPVVIFTNDIHGEITSSRLVLITSEIWTRSPCLPTLTRSVPCKAGEKWSQEVWGFEWSSLHFGPNRGPVTSK